LSQCDSPSPATWLVIRIDKNKTSTSPRLKARMLRKKRPSGY